MARLEVTELAERWALVAGASGGIGAAICRTMAADGWNLALIFNSNAAKAEEVAEQVRVAGREASIHQADLSDEARAAELVETATGDIPLSGIVYAAGPMIDLAYVSKLPPGQFRRQIEGDALAAYNIMQPAIPQLRETKGRIAALSTPGIHHYFSTDILSAAPKAVIEVIIRAIAREEGPFGIRANCVPVGIIETGIWSALVDSGRFDEAGLESIRKSLPLQSLGQPQDVAEAVTFLMSDRARWITGQSLAVDGGYSI